MWSGDKVFEVGVVVVSRTLSLEDLSTMLGGDPKVGLDRGQERANGQVRDVSVWRVDSQRNASFPDAVAEVKDTLLSVVAAVSAQQRDVQCEIEIATYFRTAMASLVLDAATLRFLADTGVTVTAYTYPCA